VLYPNISDATLKVTSLVLIHVLSTLALGDELLAGGSSSASRLYSCSVMSSDRSSVTSMVVSNTMTKTQNG